MKKVIDKHDLEQQEEYRYKIKAQKEIEELEKMLMVDKLDLELQKEAAKLKGKPLFNKER